jgi:hypothetical protein
MVDLARRNAAAAGVTNVEFLHGTIERIPPTTAPSMSSSRTA